MSRLGRLIAAALMLVACAAQARPDSVVESLMEEPASLWDIGMLRTQTLWSTFDFPDLTEIYRMATYRTDTGRIQLLVYANNPFDEEICARSIRTVRTTVLGNNSEFLLPASTFAGFFTHQAGDRTEADVQAKSIDALFVIVVQMAEGRCFGDLAKDTISYSREEW